MMRAEFTNGATVHKMWGTLPDAELIGAFPYFNYAKIFAESMAENDSHGCYFIVVDHGNGELRVFGRDTEERG